MTLAAVVQHLSHMARRVGFAECVEGAVDGKLLAMHFKSFRGWRVAAVPARLEAGRYKESVRQRSSKLVEKLAPSSSRSFGPSDFSKNAACSVNTRSCRLGRNEFDVACDEENA